MRKVSVSRVALVVLAAVIAGLTIWVALILQDRRLVVDWGWSLKAILPAIALLVAWWLPTYKHHIDLLDRRLKMYIAAAEFRDLLEHATVTDDRLKQFWREVIAPRKLLSPDLQHLVVHMFDQAENRRWLLGSGDQRAATIVTWSEGLPRDLTPMFERDMEPRPEQRLIDWFYPVKRRSDDPSLLTNERVQASKARARQ